VKKSKLRKRIKLNTPRPLINTSPFNSNDASTLSSSDSDDASTLSPFNDDANSLPPFNNRKEELGFKSSFKEIKSRQDLNKSSFKASFKALDSDKGSVKDKASFKALNSDEGDFSLRASSSF
jgi:hypothetical protein